jgi:hypothetical protein
MQQCVIGRKIRAAGFPVRDADRYRQQAEECRKQAETAFSPLDKEAWLKLAADWLQMVKLIEDREGRWRQDDQGERADQNLNRQETD